MDVDDEDNDARDEVSSKLRPRRSFDPASTASFSRGGGNVRGGTNKRKDTRRKAPMETLDGVGEDVDLSDGERRRRNRDNSQPPPPPLPVRRGRFFDYSSHSCPL